MNVPALREAKGESWPVKKGEKNVGGRRLRPSPAFSPKKQRVISAVKNANDETEVFYLVICDCDVIEKHHWEAPKRIY